jgi:hypothetical protein
MRERPARFYSEAVDQLVRLATFAEQQRRLEMQRLRDRMGGSAQGQKYGKNWRWRRAKR